MSKVIDTALAALAPRVSKGFEAVAKFAFIGEGAIMLDADGAREGDEPADVTLTATPEVFRALLAGEISAAQAFMSGKLTVDGPMGLALKLGQVLS